MYSNNYLYYNKIHKLRMTKKLNLRLCIIGAGSTYTPVLIDSILRKMMFFPFKHIDLMDINYEKLNIVGNFIKYLLEKNSSETKVSLHDEIEGPLKKANIVINLFRVGGLEARHSDTIAAIESNILGQETQGWGGFISAQRNIPVAIKISRFLNNLNPDAWLINITNPVGIITQACLREKPQKTIGICEIPNRMISSIIRAYNLPFETNAFAYIGLNHLAWITEVNRNNQNTIEEIIEGPIEKVLRESLTPNIPNSANLLDVIRALKAVPSPYLRYYYLKNEMIEIIKNSPKTRAELCIEIDKKLLNLFTKKNSRNWHYEARKRGGYLLGNTVTMLLENLLGYKNNLVIANVQNNSTLPFLPIQAVIETQIDTQIANKNEMINRINPHIRGLISLIASYEELTVEAGTKGDYKSGLLALMTHPLIGSQSIAEKLFKNALIENNKFLPQY